MNIVRIASLLIFLAFIEPSFGNASGPATNWEVDVQKPISNADADKLAADLLKDTKISVKEFFCVKNDLICRVHYTLADQNGNVIAPFIVRFVATDRSQASQAYFFPVAGQPDMFIRFEDFTFDGTVNINEVVVGNLTKVDKSSTGEVSAIHGAIVPKLGTSRFTAAEITVSAKSVVLEGIQTDKNDPTFKEHVRTEYLRTDLTN